MTDQPDDRRKRPKRPAAGEPGPEGYPPPMFAPAAEPGPEAYPPPTFAPAAEPAPAVPAPAAPAATGATEPAAAKATGAAEPAAATGTAEPAAAEPAAAEPAAADTGATAAKATEAPLLPATYRESDLRTAIGSPPLPEHIRPRRARARDDDDDDDGEGAPRRRRTVLVVAGTLVVGLGIAALVVLGRINAARYAVSCGAKAAAAERGRAFPPWGMRRLGGDAWRPVPIPPSFPCAGLATQDPAVLGGIGTGLHASPPSFPCAGLATQDPAVLGDAYRKLLVERAESLLTAKEVTQIDETAAMLEQALLHARSDSEPHRTARQAIERMLGDVGYWRASARLQKAAADLAEAAKQLETAAGQRPRYVSDASAWAAHVRKLIEELRAGPAGAKAQTSPAAAASAPPAPERPAAPPGVALPVEPAGGGSAADPGGTADSAAPPPPAPDAGVPSGGVLL